MITLKMITRLHRFVLCYNRPQSKLREGNVFTGMCLLTGGGYDRFQVLPDGGGIPCTRSLLQRVYQGIRGGYTRGGVSIPEDRGAGIPGVGIPGHGLVYQGQVYQEWGWIYPGVGISGAGGGYDLVYPLIPTPSQWY